MTSTTRSVGQAWGAQVGWVGGMGLGEPQNPPVDGPEIRRSPVEVGGLSHCL